MGSSICEAACFAEWYLEAMFETEEKDPCHKFLSLASVLLLLYLFGKLKDFPCFTCGTLYRDKNCMGATQEFMSFRCI